MDRSAGEKHRLLFWEIVVCLGPTLIYLPTGLLLVPHQLGLAIRDGRLSALWTVYYYFGIAALAVAVTALYIFVRDTNRKLLPVFVVRLCLACGVLAVAIGPFGGFVLGGSLPLYGWIGWVVMPLACVVHLVVRSKDYVIGQ